MSHQNLAVNIAKNFKTNYIHNTAENDVFTIIVGQGYFIIILKIIYLSKKKQLFPSKYGLVSFYAEKQIYKLID